jgi:multidrug resistance efflux pump
VQSVAPAIYDRERTPTGDLVADINPTFNWVRLAQRVPVRVVLDAAPADVRLIAGRTATVVDLSFESGPGSGSVSASRERRDGVSP